VEVLGILPVIIEMWKVKEKRGQYKYPQKKFKVLASRVMNMGKQSRDEKKKNKREILRKKKVKRANNSLNCTASSKKKKEETNGNKERRRRRIVKESN